LDNRFPCVFVCKQSTPAISVLFQDITFAASRALYLVVPPLCDNSQQAARHFPGNSAASKGESGMGEFFTPTHLIVLAVVVLVLFGGKKLPELGKGLGEGLRGFKEGMKGVTDEVNKPTDNATATTKSNETVNK
jgi:sec-independent protein translocase protein TatA